MKPAKIIANTATAGKAQPWPPARIVSNLPLVLGDRRGKQKATSDREKGAGGRSTHKPTVAETAKMKIGNSGKLGKLGDSS